MYTGQLVQFPGEENLFILLGVTKGRDGTILAVLEDVNKKKIQLIAKNELPVMVTTIKGIPSRLSTV